MTDSTRDARHATDVARAVCDVLPGDITAALIAVLIADDADASAASIARLLHKDASTVSRARKRLVDVGLVRALTHVSCADARALTHDSGADARSRARTHAGDRSSSSSSLFPTGTATADADAGHVATRSIFASKQPRPAQPFVAVLAIVRKLVDAGWPVDDVVAACIAVPTISTGTCEFWLNKKRALPSNAARENPERRNGETRVVTF